MRLARFKSGACSEARRVHWRADVNKKGLDIRVANFKGELLENATHAQARGLELILEAYENELGDEDEGPIIYLTLATLQMEKGSIIKSIKNKALEVLETGQGLNRWKEVGEIEYEKRIMVLKELKDKLKE